MTARADSVQQLTSDQIGMHLAALDVHFIQVEHSNNGMPTVEPEHFILSLSVSSESRIRLALIPLLLRHPHYVVHVETAAPQLPYMAQITLKCYYMATYFLQQKYALRLEKLFGSSASLPALFARELAVSVELDFEHGLWTLAERHKQLSGRHINWLGTYEHGATRFLASTEHRRLWLSSQLTKSIHS